MVGRGGCILCRGSFGMDMHASLGEIVVLLVFHCLVHVALLFIGGQLRGIGEGSVAGLPWVAGAEVS